MHPAFDYAQARENMVEQQVRPWDVLDLRVLEVLATLPREEFVAPEHRDLAYADLALPLAHGETMMKPVLEGRVLQALAVQPGESVLDIGAGSGFLAACFGLLAREVTSLEIHSDLAEAARTRIAARGLAGHVRIEAADALAWDTGHRFDAICVGAAVAEVPERFMQWLRPGGRLFAVRGDAPAMEAVLLRRDVNETRVDSLFETELPYLAGAAPRARFRL